MQLVNLGSDPSWLSVKVIQMIEMRMMVNCQGGLVVLIGIDQVIPKSTTHQLVSEENIHWRQ